MKKWFSLLLAVILLTTAAFVLAEESADPASTENQSESRFYSSSIQFGTDISTASAYYLDYWARSGFYLNKTAEQKNVTLSDGSVYVEQTYLPAEELHEGNKMTGKLYSMNGFAVACVEDITLPEGQDASLFLDQIKSFLGDSQPLNLAGFGTVAELIGEAAHLEENQPMWSYKTRMLLPATDQSTEATAYMAIRIVDNHIYMAEWPALGTSESSAGSIQNLANLNGFNELTQDEKNAVISYADFLEKQMKDQLQQYIDFLKEKHVAN